MLWKTSDFVVVNTVLRQQVIVLLNIQNAPLSKDDIWNCVGDNTQGLWDFLFASGGTKYKYCT